jgi:hypothetical protein
MKTATATPERLHIDKMDNGRWLNRLLADVQTELALQPNETAIERMRVRLFEQMNDSARRAA